MSLLVGLGLGAIGCAANAGDPVPTPTAKSKPYPLTTCVISGEKLDSMGKPVIIQYEGREVRFCCADCEKDFRKDPKPALKKLDDAAKAATQPTSPPAKVEPHQH